MRELSVIEMNEVAGAYSWDFSSAANGLLSVVSNGAELIASVAVGASVGALSIGYIGGRHGAEGGGLLGIGIISQGVGLVAGMILGGIAMGVTGAVTGLDNSLKVAQQFYDAFANGTIA
ncbi:hypothetical protein [Erwinia mallotivora]|uniref:Membrane protein n=1 Tax=Erwinia mallotivora TaxID=69222 RepID=A0A014NU44_9GAMM|nr:hypothetical protein [Erwinia mallotivora]EXU77360.1 membrane protein [Erwinia mallotivora]